MGQSWLPTMQMGLCRWEQVRRGEERRRGRKSTSGRGTVDAGKQMLQGNIQGMLGDMSFRDGGISRRTGSSKMQAFKDPLTSFEDEKLSRLGRRIKARLCIFLCVHPFLTHLPLSVTKQRG